MKRNDWLIALAVLAAYLAVRGAALMEPFILPFETAFQESIALHHLDNGMVANHFLPVVATLEGTNFHHTAHPPLLHVIYALAYKALGVHEWVTRLLSLALYFLSALLWRSMAGRDKPHGWMVLVLAFALPAPFILATTTNYEPLSLFMISLIAWLVLKRKSGIIPLAIALTVGMLVDWPVYLAAPALLAIKWRDRTWRTRLIGLVVYEAVFFAALQGAYYTVAGECAFFSHAPARANPTALFDPGTWQELYHHFIEVMGTPVAIVSAGAIVAVIWTRARERTGALDGLGFFALFSVLLVLSAPRLVSRHYVYLLYLAPLLTLAIREALSRAGVPRVALAAVLVLACSRDLVLSQQRNPGYYAMAMRTRAVVTPWPDRPVRVFSSSAVGTFRFYADRETACPVSEKLSQYAWDNPPDILLLDQRHSEVGPFLRLLSEASYETVFSVSGERLYANESSGLQGIPRRLSVPSSGSGGWVEPGSGFIMVGPGRDCPAGPLASGRASTFSCRLPAYALKQHPGPMGSSVTLALPAGSEQVGAAPAIVHSIGSVKSDGVAFMAMAGVGENQRLVFARFLADNEPRPLCSVENGALFRDGLDFSACLIQRPEQMDPDREQNRQLKEHATPGWFPMPVGEAPVIKLVTLPGPEMNYSFDDACWLEPTITKSHAGEP